VGLAAGAAESAPPEAKTFVLFMGADIDVQLGQEAHRVKNVAGDAFVITVNNKPVEVPMNRGKINMKVVPQLKLSDKAAVVKDLKIERAYTPENDPNKKWAAAQSGSAAQSLVGTTAGRMAGAQMGANIAEQNRQNMMRGAPAGTTLPGGGDVGLQSQDGGFAVTAATVFYRRQLPPGEHRPQLRPEQRGLSAQQLQEELDKKLFDAVRVTCEISSAKPMSDPYVVIITQYRGRTTRPSGKELDFRQVAGPAR